LKSTTQGNIIVNNQDNIKFYGCLKDTVFSQPYAVLSSNEVSKMVSRFQAWVAMIQTHPKIANGLGEQKAAHIKMVNALPMAIQSAKKGGTFPNVVMPQNEFQACMDLYAAQREAIKSLPKFEF
jgi:hypothetical protein